MFLNQTPERYSLTGLGIWSAAGADLLNTSEHFYYEKPVANDLLDNEETGYLKLNRNHKSLAKLDISPDLFTPNLFCLVAVNEALNQAGLSPSDLKKLRVGVCIGSTVGGTNYNDNFAADFYNERFPNAEILNNFYKTNSAQFISQFYNLNGPVLLVSNACTSGLDALGIAASWLESDLCDLVICGGTEAILQRMHYGFKSLMLIAPTGACKPFDKNRQGFVLSDGAGMMILEKASSPRKAQAYFRGYSTASDAYNPTAPHPEARGLDQAVKKACLSAGLSLSDMDFVVAHGVGTEQSDQVEGKWLAQNLPSTKIAALKGYTGHSIGASGALSVIMTAMSLQNQKLPKSQGFQNIDPEIGFSPTTTIQDGNFKYAMTLSLGFGGINSAICLERV